MNIFSLTKRSIYRIIAALVVVCFFTNSIAAGPLSSSAVTISQTVTLAPKIDKTLDICIPENFGTIVKKFLPKSRVNNKFIIHIQDAHCNYEAQHNIAKMLELLARDYQVGLVAVEGAVGDMDLGRFGKLTDEESKKRAADLFVKQGIVTGPEYLQITKYNELPFGLYGVEDGQLYVKNFMSFRDTMSRSAETKYFTTEIKKIAEQLKEKIYSEELQTLIKQIQAYSRNKLPLRDYIEWLAGKIVIDARQDPNLSILLQSVRIEKQLDFKQVEKERELLIRDMEDNAPQEDFAELVKKTMKYKLGKLSSADYYGYLGQLLKTRSENYKQLEKYIQLVKLNEGLDQREFFRELARAEEEAKANCFRNDLERELDRLCRKIDILDKLFQLQLRREDLDFFKNNKEEFSADSLVPLSGRRRRCINCHCRRHLLVKSF